MRMDKTLTTYKKPTSTFVKKTEFRRIFNPLGFCFAMFASIIVLFIVFHIYYAFGFYSGTYEYVFDYVCNVDLLKNGYSVEDSFIRYNELTIEADKIVSSDSELSAKGVDTYSSFINKVHNSMELKNNPNKELDEEHSLYLRKYYCFMGIEDDSQLINYKEFIKRTSNRNSNFIRTFNLIHSYESSGLVPFRSDNPNSISKIGIAQYWSEAEKYDLGDFPASLLPARTYLFAQRGLFCFALANMVLFGLCIANRTFEGIQAGSVLLTSPKGRRNLSNAHLEAAFALSVTSVAVSLAAVLLSGYGIVKFGGEYIVSYQVMQIGPKPIINVRFITFLAIQCGILLIVLFSVFLIEFAVTNRIYNRTVRVLVSLLLLAGAFFLTKHFIYDERVITENMIYSQGIIMYGDNIQLHYLANFTNDHSAIIDIAILLVLIIGSVILFRISYFDRIRPAIGNNEEAPHA